MKYSEEFRERKLAQSLARQIASEARSTWTIMEVCGGQTHTILQYGITDLLPPNVRLVHGPGCPVCVTPVEMIDKAVSLAGRSDVILCTFGDMLRVPGARCDLLEMKASGADVRILYSPLEAIAMAEQNPSKQVVFFAVGFETTAPANAMALKQAMRRELENFFVLCSHVTVPPVMASLLEYPDNAVQAFLGPGHVCSIMGTEEYVELCDRYKIPIAITGFEPVDILDGILACVRQLEKGLATVENRYARAVRSTGNAAAKTVMSEVFTLGDRAWRGLGSIPLSGLQLTEKYRKFDAERQFGIASQVVEESPDCISGEILRGLKKPTECPAFATKCTPETPLGATMVSSEGTCANYFKFSRKLQEQA